VPKKPVQWAIYASEFHTRGVPSPGRPLQELQRASVESALSRCAAAGMFGTTVVFNVFIPFPNVRLT